MKQLYCLKLDIGLGCIITKIVSNNEALLSDIKKGETENLLEQLKVSFDLVQEAKKELKGISFELDEELIDFFDKSDKGYLIELIKLLEESLSASYPESFLLDVSEAIEELLIFNDRIEILEKFTGSEDRFFNILHEMFLDLEQHFGYHYAELLKVNVSQKS